MMGIGFSSEDKARMMQGIRSLIFIEREMKTQVKYTEILTKLSLLKELHETGILTDEDYQFQLKQLAKDSNQKK